MKYIITFLAFITFTFISCKREKPNAVVIIKKSLEKCKAIKNGYYEMIRYSQVEKNDTFISSCKCSFKKIDDYLSPVAYHYQEFLKDEEIGNKTYSRETLYSGIDFIHTTHNDSTGELLSKSKWANAIEPYLKNNSLFTFFTDIENAPFPKDRYFRDPRYIFKLIGEEMVCNSPCYHIRVNKIPDDENLPGNRSIKNEKNFWIDKNSFYPCQYSEEYDQVNEKDTIFQFEKFTLSKYEINKDQDENIYSLNSIPAFYKIREYTPNKVLICGKRSDQVMNDTMAPDWQLKTLSGRAINLKEMKGHLVLIDFFYKGCSPCMRALPGMQALSEKYKSKGLKVIGIDTKDKKEELDNFPTERGITYTILSGDEKLARDYMVSGYPTVYLIDRNGKIVFTQAGYGKGSEEEIEEIIKRHL
jgi:peroxiredoxin